MSEKWRSYAFPRLQYWDPTRTVSEAQTRQSICNLLITV